MRSATVNLAESPLGWLKARRLVGDRQYEACERLRGDLTIAGLSPRVTMRWDVAPVSGGRSGPRDPTEATLVMIVAKRRTKAALVDVGKGPPRRAVARRLRWRGQSDAERALGWPARGQAGTGPRARSARGTLSDEVTEHDAGFTVRSEPFDCLPGQADGLRSFGSKSKDVPLRQRGHALRLRSARRGLVFRFFASREHS